MTFTARELRSTISSDGRLTLALKTVTLPNPEDDEIIIRVEAAPINPSDLGSLIGPADVSTMAPSQADSPGLTFVVPPHRLGAAKARIDQALPVGNEGAGTVVAAGLKAGALLGKRVGALGGGMYADLRKLRARDVIALPDGATALQGASMFVNPLTSLGFVETARNEGHKAIIHTAAASNLGQMLQKVCLADGVPLINIVRSREQADILCGIGATYVLNSKDGDFRDRLVDAIVGTGATVVFDAIGGGALGSDILHAMENAAVRAMAGYSRYGSNTFKQLYVYGALDVGPTTLNRLALGFQWSLSGWLLTPFLTKIGEAGVKRLQDRVLGELTTTFASRYTRVIGLTEALQPEVLRDYERKATGEKFLINPTLN